MSDRSCVCKVAAFPFRYHWPPGFFDIHDALTVVARPRKVGERTMATQLLHTIPEACSLTHTGRTSLYAAIRAGALRAVKRGRRTLVRDDDLRRWVMSLPAVQTPAPAGRSRGDE